MWNGSCVEVPVLLRPTLVAVLTLSLLGSTGCRLAQVAPLLTALGGGGPAGSGGAPGLGGAFTSASLLGSAGAPPQLQGPGVAGPAPGAMAVPADAAAAAAQFQQTYGVRLTGNGVNPRNIQAVVQGIQYYDRQQLAGLSSIELIEVGRAKSTAAGDKSGLWTGASGGGFLSGFLGGGGGGGGTVQLYGYSNLPIHPHAACHEVGHHVTLMSRKSAFGDPFLAALSSGGNPVVTSYAKSSQSELMAENLSAMLLGPGNLKWSVYGSWSPAPAARSLVQQEFGRLAI